MAVMVTGGTGFLGRLVAAGLLANSDEQLLLAVRAHHDPAGVREGLRRVLDDMGADGLLADSRRVEIAPMPPLDGLACWRPGALDEIVHCAGCLDYFDRARLDAGNIRLTAELVALGQACEVRRFTFLSTAFSCGSIAGVVAERLHPEPPEDPTHYTATKRAAENLVAHSGLPFLLVRPAVVIGDSRDGRYDGKRYGLYQMWGAAEAILCGRYQPQLHVIAPKTRLSLLHADAFLHGFLAARRDCAPGSVIHLVSRLEGAPTMRQLWEQWVAEVARPQVVHFYRRAEDVPWDHLPRRLRQWLEFTETNNHIAAREWRFETTQLDGFRLRGLEFADATPDSVARCQRRFMREAPRVRRFIERTVGLGCDRPEVVEIPGSAL